MPMAPEEKKANPVDTLKLLGAMLGAAATAVVAVLVFAFQVGALSAEHRTLPPRMRSVEVAVDSLRIRVDDRDERDEVTLCYLRALAEVGGETRDGCLLKDRRSDR